MHFQLITVAVGGHFALERAGLSALVAHLPGLQLVTLNAVPPPSVVVWEAGSRDLAGAPALPGDSALLLVVSEYTGSTLPPGVAGLFSKDEAPEALGVAIRQVARGEQYLSPALALALLQRRAAESSSPVSTDQTLRALTERERELLSLLAEGLSNKAMAARLYLSVRTVEGHLARLYAQLGVHSRTEAALLTVQLHLPPQIK